MPVTRKRKQTNQSQTQRTQPVKTSFEFSSITKYQAYYRQWNRCACCGQNLSFQQGVAHHVIPPQVGNTNTIAVDFLRATDNCVILCKPCSTHTNNNHIKNAIASPDNYSYSHGLEGIAHQQWARKLNAEGKKNHFNTSFNAPITML